MVVVMVIVGACTQYRVETLAAAVVVVVVAAVAVVVMEVVAT